MNGRNLMNTEPEEASEENPEKKIEIERIPEPMFPGTRERLSVVRDDEPDDKGDQGGGQN
jgi:hypothetical protein